MDYANCVTALNPVHYWKLDESWVSGGGSTADQVGAAAGTVSNGVDMSVEGIFGSLGPTAARFDGNSGAGSSGDIIVCVLTLRRTDSFCFSEKREREGEEEGGGVSEHM